MTIDLLTNSDPPNKITKNPALIISLEGSLVDGTNISDPDIKIEYNGFPPCNYVFIHEFNRYYYVKDITSENNGIWVLHLHVDPLKSFAAEILANTAVIARSTNTFNLYLEDSRYKAYADPIVVTRVFPSGFNTYQYVLAMLGGHD